MFIAIRINKIRITTARMIFKNQIQKSEIFKTQRNKKVKKCANIFESISRSNFKEVKKDLVGDSCK